MRFKTLSSVENLGNLFVFLGLWLLCFGLTSFGAVAFLEHFFGLSFLEMMGSLSVKGSSADAFRWVSVWQGFGVFVLPSVLFYFFYELKHQTSFFDFRTLQRPWVLVGLLALFWLAFLPLESFLYHSFKAIRLPESLRFLDSASGRYAQLSGVFLSADWSDFALNFLAVALVAALGEELFFRGVIQKQLFLYTKNPHVAIVATGFLFALMHFEFNNFVARSLLGCFLGYVYWWTGNLNMCIFYHFINNGIAVVVAFLQARQVVGVDFMEEDLPQFPFYVIIFSVILVVLLCLLIKKYACKTSD